MKRIFLLCGAVLLAGALYAAWRMVRPEHFGHAFAGAPAAEVRTLAAQPEANLEKDVRVEGTVTRQCPATGCWFYLDDGKGNNIRIEMGKVIHSLPKSVGKKAVAEGRLVLMDDEYIFAANGVEFSKK